MYFCLVGGIKLKKCNFRNVLLVGFIFILITVFGLLSVSQVHTERNKDKNDPAYFVKSLGGDYYDK